MFFRKKKDKAVVGGDWHNRDQWSATARHAESRVMQSFGCASDSQQKEMAARAVEIVMDYLCLLSLPDEARGVVMACDSALQSVRDEAKELIAQYGKHSVLYCNVLPNELKQEVIRLGGGFYLTTKEISMPLREFLFYADFLDCDRAALEEWSGIPNARMRDFYEALFGHLQTFVWQKHTTKAADHAQAPTVSIKADPGMQFTLRNCVVYIFSGKA